jgi:hypothetical protein
MKKLSLRPYHGTIWLCKNYEELHKAYKRLTQNTYPYQDGKTGGRYVVINGDTLGDRVYLVWASSKEYLAHEYCHVLLHVCDTIGYDPREGDGEPFCYMLSQLLLES